MRWAKALANAHCAAALLLAAAGSSAPAAQPGSPDAVRCATLGVAAAGWTEAEQGLVCAAAQAAIGFLGRMDISAKTGIAIRPLQEKSSRYQGCEIGYFDVQRNEISMLDPVAAAEATGETCPFRVPMSPSVWASYVSHEVAHAIIEEHFAAGVRRFAASEYIAAVVQFSTMPPRLRESILAQFADVEPYRSAREISSMYYLMNPPGFAVKVYLHYVGLGDAGPAFVRRLLREGLRD